MYVLPGAKSPDHLFVALRGAQICLTMKIDENWIKSAHPASARENSRPVQCILAIMQDLMKHWRVSLIPEMLGEPSPTDDFNSP